MRKFTKALGVAGVAGIMITAVATPYGAWRGARWIRRARGAIAQQTKNVPGSSVPETAALPSEQDAPPASVKPDETLLARI